MPREREVARGEKKKANELKMGKRQNQIRIH